MLRVSQRCYNIARKIFPSEIGSLIRIVSSLPVFIHFHSFICSSLSLGKCYFFITLVLVESNLAQVACNMELLHFVQCCLLTLVFYMHSELVKVTITGIKLLFGTILTVYEVLWCKLDSVGPKTVCCEVVMIVV